MSCKSAVMQPKIGIILINYKTYAKRFLGDWRQFAVDHAFGRI